jgi:glutamyl-tRNA synthetase
MLMAEDGRRLSKRDRDLDLGEIQKRMKPEQLIGNLAFAAGILDQNVSVSAAELAKEFSWNRVSREDICINQKLYY